MFEDQTCKASETGYTINADADAPNASNTYPCAVTDRTR